MISKKIKSLLLVATLATSAVSTIPMRASAEVSSSLGMDYIMYKSSDSLVTIEMSGLPYSANSENVVSVYSDSAKANMVARCSVNPNGTSSTQVYSTTLDTTSANPKYYVVVNGSTTYELPYVVSDITESKSAGVLNSKISYTNNTVTVADVAIGDMIKVYNEGGTLIGSGTQTVAGNLTVNVSGAINGTTIYVTRTQSGKSESVRKKYVCVASSTPIETLRELVKAKLDTTTFSTATNQADIVGIASGALSGKGITVSISSFSNTNGTLTAVINLRDGAYNTTVLNYSKTYINNTQSGTNSGSSNSGNNTNNSTNNNIGTQEVYTLEQAKTLVTNTLNSMSYSTITTQTDIASILNSALASKGITASVSSFSNKTGIINMSIGLKDAKLNSTLVSFTKAYGIGDASANDLIKYIKDNLEDNVDFDKKTDKGDVKDEIKKLLGDSNNVDINISDFENNKSSKKVTFKVKIKDASGTNKSANMTVKYDSSRKSSSGSDDLDDAMDEVEDYLDDFKPKNDTKQEDIKKKLKDKIDDDDIKVKIKDWELKEATDTKDGNLSFTVYLEDDDDNDDEYDFDEDIESSSSYKSSNSSNNSNSDKISSDSNYQMSTVDSQAVNTVKNTVSNSSTANKEWKDNDGNKGLLVEVKSGSNIVGYTFSIKEVKTSTATLPIPTNVTKFYKYSNGSYTDLSASLNGKAVNAVKVNAVAGDVYYATNTPIETSKNGWVKESAGWKYYQNNASVANKWIKTNNVWYYIGNNGIMSTGWLFSNGNYYYLTPGSGAMVTGWKYIDGNWYYLNNDGSMKRGWIQSNGKWYYLGSSGAMLSNTTVSGYKLGADGAWIK